MDKLVMWYYVCIKYTSLFTEFVCDVVNTKWDCVGGMKIPQNYYIFDASSLLVQFITAPFRS